ncbi:uncharacterized protein LOC103519808 [Diaphorina citri]|uniref:Uncharacterized protein LOC103519808 n=1 Tax=Diaphorina citri TaxID=121845 RepID=A0A3Q0JEN2_DIACI|nr:uncharacterized protein LOC103519808 [Diaphorina citri]
MLGFNIINNSGLAYLENMLYRNTPNGRSLLKSRMSSQDDLDDDTNSNYSLPMPPSVTDRGGCEASIPWRGDSHDSSSSERMDEDSDQLSLLPSHLSHLPPHFSRVHFTLGGENESPGDNSRRYVPQATRQNFVGAESEVPPGDSSRRYVPQATRQNFVGVESEAPPGDSSRRYVPQATRQGTNNVNETGQMRSGYRLAKSFSEEFSETIDQEIEKQLVKIQSSQSDNYMQESQHPPPQKPSQKHANRKPKRPLSEGCHIISVIRMILMSEYLPTLMTTTSFVGAESEASPGDNSRRYVPQATRQNFVGAESEVPPSDSSRRYVPQATRQGTNNVNETGQMRSGYRHPI